MSEVQTKSTIIENIEQLREYLQIAMKLEHATIPPYLTTAYTAKIEANKPSMDIMRAVAKEEMLHLTLAGNLLNAVGGKPDLISDDFVPPYPTHLPTGETTFEVNIEKFSTSAIQTFLNIERPAPMLPHHTKIVTLLKNDAAIPHERPDEFIHGNGHPFIPAEKKEDANYVVMVPHDKLSFKRKQTATKSFLPSVKTTDTEGNEVELHYWSIGEFYYAIRLGFAHLSEIMPPEELFCGDPSRQIGGIDYYSGGGILHKVTDLDSAMAAIKLIAGQGEGNPTKVYDDDNEIAHYYRFDQIIQGRYYRVPDKDGNNGDDPGKPQGGIFPVDMNEVFPIKTNAKVADYHSDPELEEKALLFNGQYKQFLMTLNKGFNGHPELFDPKIIGTEMFRIKYAMEQLIHYPILGTGENAAPTFEMNHFKYPSDK
jgi:hypothetical protein